MLEELLDFAAVDALAMARLDLAASSPLRAQARYPVTTPSTCGETNPNTGPHQAMVRRELKLSLAQGHCYIGGRLLEAAAARSLCCAKLKPEQAAACVSVALDTMYKKGELPTPPMANGTKPTQRRFFLPSAYAAEEKIAIAVRRPSVARTLARTLARALALALTLTRALTLTLTLTITRCAAARTAMARARLRGRRCGWRRPRKTWRRRRRRRRMRRRVHRCPTG